MLLASTCATIYLFVLQTVRAVVSPLVPSSLPGFSYHPTDFNWTQIEPSTHLRWNDCYDVYQCARLTVPLDWTNSSNANEIHIAIVKLPAKVESADPTFGGAIFLNPGGPSGSGTDYVRYHGLPIQNIADGDRHFEIISFDPRGVHRTTPSTACFDTSEARDLWTELNKFAGGADIESALNVKWALAQGLGQLCANVSHGVYPNGDNVKRYVSTALVARDMVRMIDALDEERHHTATRLRRKSQHILGSSSGKPLLNYWGFSYGSFLGNTFASMFPDRIGRMILDGNVDADDYVATGWSTNLNDNNLVWRHFFDWCFEAGPACALYDQQFQGPLNMHAKIIDLFDDIKQNPIPYIDQTGKINVLTYFNLQYNMHPYGYNPWHSWPLLATNIAALLSGDPLPFLNLSSPTSPSPPPNTTTSTSSISSPERDDQLLLDDPRFLNNTNPYPPSYAHELEASLSILCGDGEPLISQTKSNYSSYISHLVNQSSLIGPTWAQITLPCRHWPTDLRPSEANRFTGPFGSNLSDYDRGGEERHRHRHRHGDDDGDGTIAAEKEARSWARPLLFIGNTADPVTPLRNARRMSAAHQGSRVLVLDSPGHCSGPQQPSRCAWDVVRRFFNMGVLPDEGKVCGVDWRPWERNVGGRG